MGVEMTTTDQSDYVLTCIRLEIQAGVNFGDIPVDLDRESVIELMLRKMITCRMKGSELERGIG